MTYTAYHDLPMALSVEQLAKVLQVGKNTAYNLVRSGQINTLRIGHQIRIPRESLIEFLKTT